MPDPTSVTHAQVRAAYDALGLVRDVLGGDSGEAG
jgi:hypothetical protein